MITKLPSSYNYRKRKKNKKSQMISVVDISVYDTFCGSGQSFTHEQRYFQEKEITSMRPYSVGGINKVLIGLR